MYTYTDAFNDLHQEVTDALARAYGIEPEEINPNTLTILIDQLAKKRDQLEKERDQLAQKYDAIIKNRNKVIKRLNQSSLNNKTKKIERLVQQADKKLRDEIYRLLTRTVTFEYQDDDLLVSVDIICDGTVKWFVKGKKRGDNKEVSATLTNCTLEALCESEIGRGLDLNDEKIMVGLGWHDANTFAGLPPHVKKKVDYLWTIPF